MKINKVITGIIFICIGVVSTKIYYRAKMQKQNFASELMVGSDSCKNQIFYGMSDDRYKYLRNQLANTQKMMLEDPKFKNGYYTTYSKYEFSYFPRVLDWFNTDYIAPAKPIKVLDIGCAYGTFLYNIRLNLPSAELYCVDFLDTIFSKELGKTHNINFAHANIETKEIPFAEKFDVVIMTEVLEHFNYNSVSTLRKIKDALKDDGTLYISTPDSSSGWGVTKKYYESFADIPDPTACTVNGNCTNTDDHVWQYNLPELLSVINQAGFIVEKLEYSFSDTNNRHFNVALKKDSKN